MKTKNKLISFDDEIVTKQQAVEILENIKTYPCTNEEQACTQVKTSKTSKKKKRKHDGSCDSDSRKLHSQVNEQVEEGVKKKKRNQQQTSATEESNTDSDGLDPSPNETDASAPVVKKTESIRARKRRKYAELMKDKKSKAELAMQQKCLNYLSLWKHSRTEWKFEKLRQIWLQQNMFDGVKVPEEFWDTLVEYFSNSRGKARQIIIDSAIKLIENESDTDEGDVRLKRAREIVQNLQE